ncbi:hypothetical protein, partial [Brachybacterium alimentarium]|uniref:hypothetical protein n=1 Tax=Brachybacterium alimentarium TaxID=47845 RepID=UPI0031E2F247
MSQDDDERRSDPFKESHPHLDLVFGPGRHPVIQNEAWRIGLYRAVETIVGVYGFTYAAMSRRRSNMGLAGEQSSEC